MKKQLLVLLTGLFPSMIYAQTSGPNTPAINSIVPDNLTFSVADATVDELEGGSSVGVLGQTSYNNFPDQVVAVVYHASW